MEMDNNLYYHPTDSHWVDEHLQNTQAAGKEKASRFGDPLLVDPAGGDFSFQPGSPALALEIEPRTRFENGFDANGQKAEPGCDRESSKRRRSMMVSRHTFIVLALLFLPATLASARPSFVFIFADDLGWGDLGCYGNTRLKTPYLDKMAEEGLLVTNFYVANPVCSPSSGRQYCAGR